METRVIAGRYELRKKLGEGGMGAVYLAYDRELEVDIALKLLHAKTLSDKKTLERFKREVRLARQITHRNIARTYDWGMLEDNCYITMEYVEGHSLSEILEHWPVLSLPVWIDAALQISKGLEAAHEEGVTHRDLKPDNVLISESGRVLLSDFGIARIKSETGLTSANAIIGTPAYMAPEQIEQGGIDGRTDIYALGVMFYRMLTGELPWKGTQFLEMAMPRLIQPPPDPTDINDAIPRPVADLIMCAMARKPDERFQEMADVIEALQTLEIEGINLKQIQRRSKTNPNQQSPLKRLLQDTDERSPLNVQQAMPQGTTPAPSAKTASKSIAVIPFRNVGEGALEEELEELHEDLCDALSQRPGISLRITSHLPPSQLQEHDVSQLSKKLRARWLLFGTARTKGELVLLRLKLVEGNEGKQVWSQKTTHPKEELDALSDSLTETISQQLIDAIQKVGSSIG